MLYHEQDNFLRSEAFHCLEIGFILKQKTRVVTVIIDRKRVLKSIRDRINARIFDSVPNSHLKLEFNFEVASVMV